MAKFELDAWVRAIETHRPRAAGLVPASLRAVLDADIAPERLASLDAVTSGATYCPPELIVASLDRSGTRVLPSYGAPEFARVLAPGSHGDLTTRGEGNRFALR